MSDKALRDELMTMLVAGQETSAILLGWASALLAHHPRVQVRALSGVVALQVSSESGCGRNGQSCMQACKHARTRVARYGIR
jgi:cytochrome P450